MTQNGKAAAVLLALAEFDRLTARGRFVAAVQEGLDDRKAGRIVSDEELGHRLDTRFGALPKKKSMVRWTERAVADLVAVGDDIAVDNPEAARAWVERLRQGAVRAGDLPDAGRVVPEIGRNDVREVFLRTYRIVYRAVGEGIVVLTVFEGHKPLSDLDPDDWGDLAPIWPRWRKKAGSGRDRTTLFVPGASLGPDASQAGDTGAYDDFSSGERPSLTRGPAGAVVERVASTAHGLPAIRDAAVVSPLSKNRHLQDQLPGSEPGHTGAQ